MAIKDMHIDPLNPLRPSNYYRNQHQADKK